MATTKERKMSLAGVHRGKKATPDRIVLYGPEGVGKSTWASEAPKPIFIATEDGVAHLDVASFDSPRPQTYAEVLDCVKLLTAEQHPYQTLVVDTIDWLEHLVRDKVIAENRDPKSSRPWTYADYEAYGRGFNLAANEFRTLLALVERLQEEKGMEVIFICHAQVASFQNPAGDDYMRYQLKLGGKVLPALFKEWCKNLLFANYDDVVHKKERKARTGDAVAYTTRTAAWDAKNRWGLPAQINLDYEEYAGYRAAEVPASTQELKNEIAELRAKLELDPAAAKKLDEWIAKAGENPSRLRSVARQLRERVPVQEDE